MTWFKVDDDFWSHPKVVALPPAAGWLWTRAGSYCGRHLTDGFVSHAAMGMLAGKDEDANALVAAGLWLEVDGGHQFHDWHTYQPTRESVTAQRRSDAARQALSRDPELRNAIKVRDGDRCRYCGQIVKWDDRRSASGGTYDHLTPNGVNTLDNLVVACRGCNARKGARTPEQAGMTLIQNVTGSVQVTNQAPIPSPVPYPNNSNTDHVSPEGDVPGNARQTDLNVGAVQSTISLYADLEATDDEAARYAHHILVNSTGVVKHQTKYVCRSIENSPAECSDWFIQHRRHLKAAS